MSLRILVVDDESMIRRVYARLIKEESYEMLEAEDVSQAISVFEREQPIDILIADVRLRHEDGIVLAKELLRRQPSLQIVICSGDPYRKIDMEPGTYSFLEKPFTIDMFKKLMAELEERRRSAPDCIFDATVNSTDNKS